MTQKMSIVCNGDTPANIMPTLIFSTSGLSLDYEVHVFICPAGARWMLKGEMEKLGAKGHAQSRQTLQRHPDLGGEIVFASWRWRTRILNPEDRDRASRSKRPALSDGCRRRDANLRVLN
jgi:predicted peroxiredoxin